MAAAQEQDRQHRLEFEKWAKGMFARMDERDKYLSQLQGPHARLLDQVAQLSNHQSQRMDRYDIWLEQNGTFQQEALRLLNRILNRLPGIPPNPN